MPIPSFIAPTPLLAPAQGAPSRIVTPFSELHKSYRCTSTPRCTLTEPQTSRTTKSVTAPAYKLGLCLAGAATGGAYSAGVIDFLFEALTAWQAKKDANDPDVPPWCVEITDIAGTSAGGITSLLAVAALNTAYTPLPRGYVLGDRAPQRNPLFSTWVKKMDYRSLFSNADLDAQPEGRKKVESFLNANFMEETALEVLRTTNDFRSSLPSWGKDIMLSLTATNLRGVPYSVDHFMTDPEKESQFRMRQYADYTPFMVTTDPCTIDEAQKKQLKVLNLAERRDTGHWKHAIDCARATSAFPIGFPTVKLTTPKSFYNDRLDATPDWDNDKNLNNDDGTHVYAAVDGAVMNNDPFGLLERQMVRHGCSLNCCGADRWGTVVLIDPFPQQRPDQGVIQDGMPLVPLLANLYTALRGQSMFKEEEFLASLNTERMERFMIIPERDVRPGQEYQLATNTMFHFGGIFDEKIRLHDFELGRVNCKHFLEHTFCIPRAKAMETPIFKEHKKFLDRERIPIIPVVGSAARPLSAPDWPAFESNVKSDIEGRVNEAMRERFGTIADVYLENLHIVKNANWRLGQFLINRAAKKVRNVVVDELSKKAGGYVDKAMRCYVE